MSKEQKQRLNKRVEEQCTTLEEALSKGEINLIPTDSGGWQIRIYAIAFPSGIGIGYGDESYSEKEIETYLEGVLAVLEAFS